ncbi:MAG: thioredoxin fold domain-containing protein [Rhodospirillales bacterium]|nr:thioredoxin fold domain-containing protein [Rhodospirillales bacterium]
MFPLRLASLLLVAAIAWPASAATIHREDGVHTEDWFNNQSFMELKEDARDAVAQEKGFVVIWEQPGCGSCQRLHEVNFQHPKLADYIGRRFSVMVMNMFGEVPVTDFDGEVMPEKDLAFKHKVSFTPTTIFFDADGKELFRMPGYFNPYFYLAGFVFVAERGFADEATRGMFPRWLQANGPKVRAAFGGGPGS